MFTGIVEELGTVESVEEQQDALRLSIRAGTVLEGTGLGDSISVNGCCLTVAERVEGGFTADVMHATLAATGLGGLREGSRVNLERAVTPTTRLGGHVVQGRGEGGDRRVLVDVGDGGLGEPGAQPGHDLGCGEAASAEVEEVVVRG